MSHFAPLLHLWWIGLFFFFPVSMGFLVAQDLETEALAQNTHEDVGKQLVEAVRAGDFLKIADAIPKAEVIERMMEMNDLEASKAADAASSAIAWHSSLQKKLKQEWNDMLMNAEKNGVKLPKLAFDQIANVEDYPQMGYPTRLVRMALSYRRKSLVLAFWTVEMDGKWYYIGCQEGANVFQQLDH